MGLGALAGKAAARSAGWAADAAAAKGALAGPRSQVDAAVSTLNQLSQRAQAAQAAAEGLASQISDGSGADALAQIQSIVDTVASAQSQASQLNDDLLAKERQALQLGMENGEQANALRDLASQYAGAAAQIGRIYATANSGLNAISSATAKINRALADQHTRDAAIQLAQQQQAAVQAAEQARQDRLQAAQEAAVQAQQQRDANAQAAQLAYQQAQLDAANQQAQAQTQAEQAKIDAQLQQQQMQLEFQAQQEQYRQQAEAQKADRDAQLQAMLLQAQLMQAAPQLFQGQGQQAMQQVFAPYGLTQGGNPMPFMIPAGSPGQGPSTWAPVSPDTFTTGPELFGLGAGPQTNPELQGAMIETGYSVVPTNSSNPLERYVLVSPRGQPLVKFSGFQPVRSPAGKPLYVPPRGGPGGLAGLGAQAELVQGGMAPAGGGTSVADTIAQILQTGIPAAADAYRTHENQRLELARVRAGLPPLGEPAPMSIGTGEIPTAAYVVGGLALGAVVIGALVKKKRASGAKTNPHRRRR